ncbi:hypothetical protein DPMN_152057 [Dreissena polymorpha]|uniref:Uncharacterized protein n=1 Tax=Dreissena polymorpha TaxID=45954 RepID=A0A9D4FGI2_DREPO|nr:hypothetical protein DPMN_152057 [Dreissena polymorpha]
MVDEIFQILGRSNTAMLRRFPTNGTRDDKAYWNHAPYPPCAISKTLCCILEKSFVCKRPSSEVRSNVHKPTITKIVRGTLCD